MRFAIRQYALDSRGIRTRSQGGIMVLAIMLILVAGSSYMLVKKFNANAQKARADSRTMEALKTAKGVLMSYAVRFPETDAESPGDEIDGPGYLPCPDVNNDGEAVGSCSDGGNTTIGRFPFKTLGVSELRDGSGTRLWYALSENYRNNPKQIPLNSDIQGTLQVDSLNDIVAVVFAAGEPVGDQNSRGSVTETIEDYLEGENSNYDQVFTRSGVGNFNDRLVIITRDELMEVVEKRVLGDVSRTLKNYYASHDALPWLSPYSDPITSAFHGIVDTYAGHIPFHWSGDEPGETNRNPFDTSIGWIWHTDPGTATGYWDGTVTPDCLRDVDCDDGLFPPIAAVEKSSHSCEWSSKETVNCDDSGWIKTHSISCNEGCLSSPGTCERRYYVKFPEYTGTEMDVTPPGADASDKWNRKRNVYVDTNNPADYPDQSRAVEIVDTFTGLTPSACSPGTEIIGDGYINFTSNTTGRMGTINIKYDLDMDDNELPGWFVENDWHEMTYIAYPESEAYPGDNDTQCTAGTDCLNLSWIGDSGTELLSNGVRALVMLSGKEINTQTGNRPSPDLRDYYENADGPGSLCQADGGTSVCNYDGNTEYVSGRKSDNFNDRVRAVLETN